MRSYMNWWVKCISAVIVKTASRNVAFKATRMRDSIMEGQDKFVMRELDNADVGLREDCEEDLVDVGCCNAPERYIRCQSQSGEHRLDP